MFKLFAAGRALLPALTVALILTFIVAARPALAQTPDTAASGAATGETPQVILMQFAPDTSEAQRMARIAALGGEMLGWMPQIQVAEVRIPPAVAQVAAAGATALAAPEVTFVEADLPVVGVDLPNDPAFGTPATAYGYTRIEAPAAWQITTGGAQVIIAVLDSGVKLDHPELAAQLVSGYDFVNHDASPDDDSGHGTHVAGVIGAAIDNDQGLAGVCPGCRIMPVKVLNADNLGTWGNLARGVLFATDNGARIINLSLGSVYTSQTLGAAIDYARQHGVLIVAAAGNTGRQQPFYPAALEGVIAVSATNAQDEWWPFSSYGDFVDLAAPGDLIYSTFAQLDNAYGGYTYMSGTSMATPFVSGLAGLVLSSYPQFNAGDVTAALLAGADDLGTPGPDPYFGQGRINAYRTLSLLTTTVPSVNGGSNSLRLFLPAIQTQ
jgi:type VII secretion-associated serine protease mycosin